MAELRDLFQPAGGNVARLNAAGFALPADVSFFAAPPVPATYFEADSGRGGARRASQNHTREDLRFDEDRNTLNILIAIFRKSVDVDPIRSEASRVNGHKALRTFKSEFFKALAHPLRIHILDELREGELNVGELRERLGVELANVSQQLSILRAKKLVSTRKQGSTVYYSVTDPALFELLDAAKAIFNNHLIEMQDMLQVLNED